MVKLLIRARVQLSYNSIKILKYSIGQSPYHIVPDDKGWKVAKIKAHNLFILGEFAYWNPKEAIKLGIKFDNWLMIEVDYKRKNLHFRFYN